MRRKQPRPDFLTVLAVALLSATSAFAAERVRHTVTVDGHPIALWEKSAANTDEAILLVHGRTLDDRLDLWDHIGNVLAAMQGAAAELELDGRLARD